MNTLTWDAGWQLWDLIGFLSDKGVLQSRTIFRGHAHVDWKLVPSLYRREIRIYGEQSQAELYVIAERRMLDTFFDRGALLLPQFARNEFLDRVIAQHYGVPTQLLDWTLDPLIALFFAVSDEAQEDADGALFYATPMQGYNSKAPLLLPFTGKFSWVRPPVVDDRVAAQKSVFTVQSFGSAENFVPLEDRNLQTSKPGDASHPLDEVSAFGKVVIPKGRKLQILGQLMDIGIDASHVFPGLQGIGQRIAAHAKIKNYGGDGLF